MNDNYEDIIDLPHHVSQKRPQMPMQDRAAQFSPFAALTGYDAAVKEAARFTDSPVELSEEELELLNRKLNRLLDNIPRQPLVSFTCFKPDDKKSGGSYVTCRGVVKKVDICKRLIIMQDGTLIPMDQVLDIEIREETSPDTRIGGLI